MVIPEDKRSPDQQLQKGNLRLPELKQHEEAEVWTLHVPQGYRP